MPVSIEDQQQVYLAFRSLFKGPDTQIRKTKAISQLLKARPEFEPAIIERLGRDKVISIIKALLVRGVFQSDPHARAAFPKLFETSPEQYAKHEASNEGAAKSEAENLQEFVAAEAVNKQEVDRVEVLPKIDQAPNPEAGTTQRSEALPKDPVAIPCLYPVQMPLSLQHEILCKVQKLLEETCFDFTQKYNPRLIEEQQWDCVEAIELNQWVILALKPGTSWRNAPSEATSSMSPGFLHLVVRVRHTAVHRLRVSAKSLSMMIGDAVKFSEALGDLTRASLLQEILEEISNAIKSHELNKNYLESGLKSQLEEIHQQRQELDRRERNAIEAMIARDAENTALITSTLKASFQELIGCHTAQEDFVDSVENQVDIEDEEEQDEKQANETVSETMLINAIHKRIQGFLRSHSANFNNPMVRQTEIFALNPFCSMIPKNHWPV